MEGFQELQRQVLGTPPVDFSKVEAAAEQHCNAAFFRYGPGKSIDTRKNGTGNATGSCQRVIQVTCFISNEKWHPHRRVTASANNLLMF